MNAIGIPLLIFLAVSFLTILFASTWDRFFSAKSKAVKKRIKELSAQNIINNANDLKVNQESIAFLQSYIEKTVWYSKLNLLCIQAGSHKQATQILQYGLMLLTISFLIFLFLDFNIFVALLLGSISGALPVLKLINARKKRVAKFEEQLPDVLSFLSRALLSGHGIAFAFTMAAEEFPSPLGYEFKITSDQLNYGLSFPEALSQLNTRVESSDLSFFVVSLLIQRETGGNLADILTILSSTIRERLKLRGKVRILASEAKLSSKVLLSLPFVLGSIMAMVNMGYISLLWTTPEGQHLMKITAVMIPAGMFWMSKIVDIKV